MEKQYEELMEIFSSDDYSEAKLYGISLLEEAKSNNDLYHMTKLYYLLAYICEYTDDFGNAIIYYLEGARYGLMSEDQRLTSDVISIHKNFAALLANYKHYDLAHRFLNEGLNLAIDANKENQIVAFTNNRIFLYLDQKQFQNAIDEIESLRATYNISPENNVILLNKLGWAQQSLSLTDDAVNSYMKVINDSASLGQSVYAISLQNIALIKRNQKEFDSAIQYYNNSITYCIKYGFNRWLLRSYSDLGSLYLKIGDVNNALKFFELGVDLVNNGDQSPESYDIFKLASQAYTNIGNLEQALTYKELYSQKLEEYIDQQNEITELGQLYNIQLLTDRYYDLLAADMEQKETERLAKFGIGGTASFFLIILSIMVYRQRRTKVLLAREINELHLTSEV